MKRFPLTLFLLAQALPAQTNPSHPDIARQAFGNPADSDPISGAGGTAPRGPLVAGMNYQDNVGLLDVFEKRTSGEIITTVTLPQTGTQYYKGGLYGAPRISADGALVGEPGVSASLFYLGNRVEDGIRAIEFELEYLSIPGGGNINAGVTCAFSRAVLLSTGGLGFSPGDLHIQTSYGGS